MRTIYLHVGALTRLVALMFSAGVMLPWVISIWVDYPALEVSLFCAGFTIGLVFGAWKAVEAFVYGLMKVEKDEQEQD